MSDIITVKNLVEVYSDGTKAVDDISFSVQERSSSVSWRGSTRKNVSIKTLISSLEFTRFLYLLYFGFGLDANNLLSKAKLKDFEIRELIKCPK